MASTHFTDGTMETDKELAAVVRAGCFASEEDALREAVQTLFAVKPQLRLEAAVRRYQDGEITLARAAELTEMTRWRLQALLGRRGIRVEIEARPTTEYGSGGRTDSNATPTIVLDTTKAGPIAEPPTADGARSTLLKRREGHPMRHLAAAVLLALASTSIALAQPPEPSRSTAAEFRRIIETAKARVYPALVFVKPIREEFSGGEQKRQEVFGSGVIISPDGFAVTNHHVIDQAVEIQVVLSDKRQVPAEIVGKDAETDLALLRLKGLNEGEALPYAAFADSEHVQSGDFVMAFGSPFGFARSVSLGIVSNTERYLGFETKHVYNNFIQTDAAINPGNSGGPLVDIDGQIVGINTLAMASGQGLGFSIPSNVVRDVVERLRSKGRVDRAWTGLQLQPLIDFNSNTITKSDAGVLVRDVEKDSPAVTAGFIAGDILLEINAAGITAKYAEDLPAVRRQLADLPIGQPSKLAVRRGGQSVTLEIKPVLKGSIDGADFACKRWNLTVKEFNEFSDPDLYFYEKGGVFVNGVRFPGNAQKAGLRRRDIILKIDGREVKSVEDVKKVYEELTGDTKRPTRALLEIRRGQFKQPIVLDYKEDFSRGD
jgi:serine protease Do